MYSVEQLLKGITKPKLGLLEVRKQIHRAVLNDGIHVMKQDWDNLIILDACRYDLFRDVNSIDGELSPVISLGSDTTEFLRANFNGEYPDTIYLSANPKIQKHITSPTFHERIPLWETEWDDELNTVPPHAVVDAAAKYCESYHDKRLIVHFMQPHYPFIGETGRAIHHGTFTGEGILNEKREHPTIWEQLQRGDVDSRKVLRAYEENLGLVLGAVEELLERLTGKTVVTSDHGNAFGEWGIYGHPGNRFIMALVRVPWLETTQNQRKPIEEGKLEDEPYLNSIEDKLQSLGYR